MVDQATCICDAHVEANEALRSALRLARITRTQTQTSNSNDPLLATDAHQHVIAAMRRIVLLSASLPNPLSINCSVHTPENNNTNTLIIHRFMLYSAYTLLDDCSVPTLPDDLLTLHHSILVDNASNILSQVNNAIANSQLMSTPLFGTDSPLLDTHAYEILTNAFCSLIRDFELLTGIIQLGQSTSNSTPSIYALNNPKTFLDLRTITPIIVTIQHCLRTDIGNDILSKYAIHLLRRLVDYSTTFRRPLNTNTGLLSSDILKLDSYHASLFAYDTDTHNEFVASWQEFFVLYDITNESMVHLVQPFLPRFITFFVTSKLHDSWWAILLQRAVSSRNIPVKRAFVEAFIGSRDNVLLSKLASYPHLINQILLPSIQSPFLFAVSGLGTYRSSFGEMLAEFISLLIHNAHNNDRERLIQTLFTSISNFSVAIGPLYIFQGIYNSIIESSANTKSAYIENEHISQFCGALSGVSLITVWHKPHYRVLLRFYAVTILSSYSLNITYEMLIRLFGVLWEYEPYTPLQLSEMNQSSAVTYCKASYGAPVDFSTLLTLDDLLSLFKCCTDNKQDLLARACTDIHNFISNHATNLDVEFLDSVLKIIVGAIFTKNELSLTDISDALDHIRKLRVSLSDDSIMRLHYICSRLRNLLQSPILNHLKKSDIMISYLDDVIFDTIPASIPILCMCLMGQFNPSGVERKGVISSIENLIRCRKLTQRNYLESFNKLFSIVNDQIRLYTTAVAFEACFAIVHHAIDARNFTLDDGSITFENLDIIDLVDTIMKNHENLLADKSLLKQDLDSILNAECLAIKTLILCQSNRSQLSVLYHVFSKYADLLSTCGPTTSSSVLYILSSILDILVSVNKDTNCATLCLCGECISQNDDISYTTFLESLNVVITASSVEAANESRLSSKDWEIVLSAHIKLTFHKVLVESSCPAIINAVAKNETTISNWAATRSGVYSLLSNYLIFNVWADILSTGSTQKTITLHTPLFFRVLTYGQMWDTNKDDHKLDACMALKIAAEHDPKTLASDTLRTTATGNLVERDYVQRCYALLLLCAKSPASDILSWTLMDYIITQMNSRSPAKFIDSPDHRFVHRCWCIILVLLPALIANDDSEHSFIQGFIFNFALRRLAQESMSHVRCLIECALIRCLLSVPSLADKVFDVEYYGTLGINTKKTTKGGSVTKLVKPFFISSIMTVAYHCLKESKRNINFFSMKLFVDATLQHLIAFSSSNHFTIRLFSHITASCLLDVVAFVREHQALNSDLDDLKKTFDSKIFCAMGGILKFIATNEDSVKHMEKAMLPYYPFGKEFKFSMNYSFDTFFYKLPLALGCSPDERISGNAFLRAQLVLEHHLGCSTPLNLATPIFDKGTKEANQVAIRSIVDVYSKNNSSNHDMSPTHSATDITLSLQKKIEPWSMMQLAGVDIPDVYGDGDGISFVDDFKVSSEVSSTLLLDSQQLPGGGDLWNENNQGEIGSIPVMNMTLRGRNANFRARNSIIVVASLIDKIPNLGGLCRTCEVMNAELLTMGNLKHTVDSPIFASTAVTADKWLPMMEVKEHEIGAFLVFQKKRGYSVLGLEQATGSKSVEETTFPEKCVILLGNEKEGIPAPLIRVLDHIVEIPQFGMIRSLNVHVSGSILLWEYTRQRLTLASDRSRSQ